MARLSSIPSKKYAYIPYIILVLFTCLSFIPVFQSELINWQDSEYILNSLTGQLTPDHVGQFLKQRISGEYIPLTTLSFAVENFFFARGQIHPVVYHVNSLILHILTVLLIYACALRLGLSKFGATISALLFAVHPLHVEPVVWIASRKDVLYSCIYLLAFYQYILYLDSFRYTTEGPPETQRRYLVLASGIGIVSMFASPMALSLPFALLALDWLRGRAINRAVIIEKAVLLAAAAVLGWATFSSYDFSSMKNIFQSFLVGIWAFVFYLRHFIFPFISMPVYRVPQPVHITQFEYIVSAVALAAMIWAVFRFRRHRWLLFSFFFYAISIIFSFRPFDIDRIDLVSNRYMYLPSLGYCFVVGVGAGRFFYRKDVKVVPLRRSIVIVAIIAAIILFSVTTYQHAVTWRNSISLWAHLLRYNPDEPFGINKLAEALEQLPEYQQAKVEYARIERVKADGYTLDLSEEQVKQVDMVKQLIRLYEAAVRLKPDFLKPHYNLSRLYTEVGMEDASISKLQHIIDVQPDQVKAIFSLGKSYIAQEQTEKAIAIFDGLLERYPDQEDNYMEVVSIYRIALEAQPAELEKYKRALVKTIDKYITFINGQAPRDESFVNLGDMLVLIGAHDRAVSAYRMALSLNEKHLKAITQLSNLYFQMGQISDAVIGYEKAIELNPNDYLSHMQLGKILGAQRDLEKAKKHYELAIKINPGYADGYTKLAFISEIDNRFQDAIKYYMKSIELNPTTEAYYNCGNVHVQLEQYEKAVELYLKAVEINPNFVDGWVNLSVVTTQLGNMEQAARYLDEAILLGYNPPAAHVEILRPYLKSYNK